MVCKESALCRGAYVHRQIIIKVFRTGGQEFSLGGDSADGVAKGVRETAGHVNEELFQGVDVVFFIESFLKGGCFFREQACVAVQVPAGDCGYGLSLKTGSQLVENPGISDGGPANHETSGVATIRPDASCHRVHDVAIGDDGAGHELDGTGNPLRVHRAAVAFENGSAVDDETVWAVFGDNVENGGEFFRFFPPEPAFDGEGSFGQGIAHPPEDGVHGAQFAQKSATCILVADEARRTSHVQVDAGNGVFHEHPGIAHKGIAVVAYELGVDGPPSRVFINGAQDLLVRLKVMGAGTEVFRNEVVRQCPKCGQNPEECQVRNVFHGCQCEEHVRCIQGSAS